MKKQNLFRTRKFLPIFATQFSNAFNDNLFKNALIILIAFRGVRVFGIGPDQMVAAAGGIFILPFFLFSAAAGEISDKFRKNFLIRTIKAAEILFMAIAAFGFLRGHYELLFVTLFLMGLHSTYFGPIKYSILPQLVGERELVEANAYVNAGTFIAILLGTIGGGWLISLGQDGEFWESIAVLVVAVTGFLTSLFIPETPAAAPNIRVSVNPVAPTVRVWKTMLEHRAVYLAILGISWFWFFGAAVLSVLPLYGRDYLHANEAVVTFFLALFSIGVAVGSVLCNRLSHERLELGLVPMGAFLLSFFTCLIGILNPPAAALAASPATLAQYLGDPQGILIAVCFFLLAISGGLFIVPLVTLVQERSPDSLRSRIIAGGNIVNALFMVLASVMVMILLKVLHSIHHAFLVIAALNALMSIYVFTVLPEFMLRFATWALGLVMYRVKTSGLENIPREGPAILVCNHQSFVDWLIIFGAVKRPVRFVMHFSYGKNPFIGFFVRQAKTILIADREESTAMLKASFAAIGEELKQGNLICIFPEGNLTSDGSIARFKRGVERILAIQPAPVVPMGLHGLWGSYFSRMHRIKPGRYGRITPRARTVWLRAGMPISPELATVERLEQQVRALAAEPHLQN